MIQGQDLAFALPPIRLEREGLEPPGPRRPLRGRYFVVEPLPHPPLSVPSVDPFPQAPFASVLSEPDMPWPQLLLQPPAMILIPVASPAIVNPASKLFIRSFFTNPPPRSKAKETGAVAGGIVKKDSGASSPCQLSPGAPPAAGTQPLGGSSFGPLRRGPHTAPTPMGYVRIVAPTAPRRHTQRSRKACSPPERGSKRCI